MSFSGNFQRPNPPVSPKPAPAQSEEEKALAEQKRRLEEDLKKPKPISKNQDETLS